MKLSAAVSIFGLGLVFVVALVTTPAAGPAAAQEEPARFDVLSAVHGVWAYDVDEVSAPGDFTCADRPIALVTVDGGARIASKRPGDEMERYGLVLDVRNDFPLGPALSIVWEDAPLDTMGAPIASVLVMTDTDRFMWISGEALNDYQSGARGLERSPMRARCAA